MYSRISRISQSPIYRAGADFARKHSRVSKIAAAAAAVGALSAVSISGGAAPWAQAMDNASKSVQAAPQSNAGQPKTNLFAVVTGTESTQPTSGAQLTALRSAATGGSTAPFGNAGQQHQAAAPAKLASHAAPAKPKAHPVPAKPKAHPAPAKPKAHAAPAKPYTIYDSVSPSSIPAGQNAAVYANGAYAASSNQMAGHHKVLWIDTNGSDPKANVLDVEPGDATPAGAAHWVQQKLSSDHNGTAVVYTMMSDWGQVKAQVGHLPGWMQHQVKYWIADPTGTPHVVPGSDATQWYWGSNYDLTTANPGFSQ